MDEFNQGQGWHGESLRHRLARLMGHAPGGETPSQINSQPGQTMDSQMSDDELRRRIAEIERAQQVPVKEEKSSDDTDEDDDSGKDEELNIESF